MPKIKICGNKTLADVKLAIDLGADYIGFIFAGGKRHIEPQQAQSIIKEFPDYQSFVGVFANQPKQEVEKIAQRLNLKWLQFHGDETSRYCESFMKNDYKVIKSFRIKDRLSIKRLDEYNVSAFLFDTYSKHELGGTGQSFDWTIIEDKPYVHERLFLAGGLTVDTLQKAISLIKPYAVDIASGVEKSPGVKDPVLLKQIIKIAKGEKQLISVQHQTKL